MSRSCAVTGKKVLYGNKVSHSNRKTPTRFEINLQPCSFPSELLGRAVRMRLTPNGIRTVEKNGGIDAWLLSAKPARIDQKLRQVRKALVAAQARAK